MEKGEEEMRRMEERKRVGGMEDDVVMKERGKRKVMYERERGRSKVKYRGEGK